VSATVPAELDVETLELAFDQCDELSEQLARRVRGEQLDLRLPGLLAAMGR
jgi:hypothetical protein